MTSDPFESVLAQEYSSNPDEVFFNSASFGLLPKRGIEALRDFAACRNRPRGVPYSDVLQIHERARQASATLIGASAREIALTPNTSQGVNLAAACAARGEPGTILVSAGEFPCNVYPWLALENRGFTVQVVPTDDLGRPDEEALEIGLQHDDVRALALSSVQFASGYLADLDRFGAACRERGILFAVDAIQSLGVVPMDVKRYGIDILSCGAQKWLCSPWGSGFVYVDGRLHDAFDPPMVSWLSFESASDFEHCVDYRYDFVDDGRKFELATLGVINYLGMAHSIELILSLGVPQIQEHVSLIMEPLLAWIEERGDVKRVTPPEPERRAGILSFTPPELDSTAEALTELGVIFAVREDAIRLSPHFYNTVEEMERVVAELRRLG